MVDLLLKICAVTFAVLGALCQAAAGVLMILVIIHRKPHVRLFLDTFFNPFNLVLAPHLLTETGRQYWKKMLICVGMFFVFSVLALLCALMYPADQKQ